MLQRTISALVLALTPAISIARGVVALAIGDHVQEARLTASPPMPATEQETAPVDIQGNTLVCGYPTNKCVLVYERNAHSWTQVATILPPPAQSTTNFGYAVALDGNTLIIGCRYYQATSSTPQGGAALVYVGAGANWTLEAILQLSAPIASDWFGFAVALQGNTAVVGAPLRESGTALDAGSVSVFVRSGTTWSQQAELFDPVPEAGANLGHSVALEGSTLAAGEPRKGDPFDEGAVAVFDLGGSGWAWSSTLPHPALWPISSYGNDNFGWSVALVGDRLVVGAPRCDDLCASGTNVNHGSLGLYERVGGNWSYLSRIASPDNVCTGTSLFGTSIDFDGTTILTGATGSCVVVCGSGRAFLHAWNNPIAQEVLLHSTPTTADNFGTNVALGVDRCVVGAFNQVLFNTYRGQTYVFAPLQPDISRTCFGDGMQNGGPDCPCANNAPVGAQQGCKNSSMPIAGLTLTEGAFAVGLGSTSVTTDDLEVHVWNVLPSVLCVLFAGHTLLPNGGSPFGAGIRCAGIPQRLGTQLAFADGSAAWGPGVVGQAMWSAGAQRWLQVYYRDPSGPCSTFNLSHAVEITVLP